MASSIFSPGLRHRLAQPFRQGGSIRGGAVVVLALDLLVDDADETLVVNYGDVAGNVPAIAAGLGGLPRLVQVADHAIGTFHHQQAGVVGCERLEGHRVHNLRRDARQRMANGARLVAGL